MSISTNNSISPAAQPKEEQAWRAQAEEQLAELRQALATAQAQVKLQSERLQELFELLPGGAKALGTSVAMAKLPVRSALPPHNAATEPHDVVQAQLLADNPNPVLRLTATGEVRYANPAAQALGPALTHALQPSGYLLPLVRAALRLGTAQQQQVSLADDWYLLQVVPGRGDTCATLYLTNTTARHCAEQGLAEQRDFYETILNALAVDVAVFDPEHRYQFVNTSAVKNPMVREWIIGKNNDEYCAHRQLPAEVATERKRRFVEACHTRASVQWEETITTPEGPQQWVRMLQPLYRADGTLRLVVGSGINNTKRHQAERKLAEQQAFYELVLNQMPCDIGVFDAQFRYLFVNERGMKDPAVREWVIGKDDFAYFARTNRPRAMGEKRTAQFEQAVRERRLTTFEETFPRPDGTRHLLRCIQPVFNPDGSTRMLVGYGLDITERVQAEQTLLLAKQAAEESARVKEAFLANMSHEIRTPMNAILGMSQLLAKTPLSADQLNYQQAIGASAENLLVIINDILDLSKLEAGKLVLEIIGFAPAHLLAQVEQTLRFKAAEKGLGLVTVLNPQVPPVLLGDPYRIRQVLLNLADNALKFTSKGLVTVECAILAPTPDMPADTVAIEFKVTDTGIGIEPEYLATMFTEFSQADSSVTRKYGGTGLGLSICRDMVKLMDSEIHVSSKKNKGTTTQFTLHLPVGPPQAIARRKLPMADIALRMHHLRGKRVLIVEDNLFNRQIAKSFLSQAEVHVVEAEHGAQAIDLVQRHQFDLILMDVQMPVMDGYAATAFLRQQLGLATPIIALTANAINGEREKCLAAGMNAYLAKPFQEAQLLQLLLDWAAPAAPSAGPEQLAPEPTPPAPAEPTPPPSLYSIDDLLKAGQGDPEFVEFMLHTFAESCQEAFQDLHRGLREADVKLLKGTAHTLKPSLQHLNAWHALPPVEKLNQWSGDFALAPLQALVAEIELLLNEVLTLIALDLREERIMTRVLIPAK
ncbi:response regulator [Hymenobacter sp. HMF4947]|uniref:Sensory/regulatory protein RpfC n=1 Tax=Hymenobacter ginkgonis TaxID=2682976 RepID=A0A7K1TCE1_9BACT|nr:PAS domain-containing hybrid sensor histidine kinase/response regulator [Hymenobacter ginkgonis]MVN76076.1 response regulator [Hymenobacter ginkgonis]